MSDSNLILKKLIDTIKTELDESDIEQKEGGEPTVEDTNRMLEMDRSPIHSDTPDNGMVTTEYGANAAIKKHMNRQMFGALQKGKARRSKKVAT